MKEVGQEEGNMAEDTRPVESKSKSSLARLQSGGFMLVSVSGSDTDDNAVTSNAVGDHEISTKLTKSGASYTVFPGAKRVTEEGNKSQAGSKRRTKSLGRASELNGSYTVVTAGGTEVTKAQEAVTNGDTNPLSHTSSTKSFVCLCGLHDKAATAVSEKDGSIKKRHKNCHKARSFEARISALRSVDSQKPEQEACKVLSLKSYNSSSSSASLTTDSSKSTVESLFACDSMSEVSESENDVNNRVMEAGETTSNSKDILSEAEEMIHSSPEEKSPVSVYSPAEIKATQNSFNGRHQAVTGSLPVMFSNMSKVSPDAANFVAFAVVASALGPNALQDLAGSQMRPIVQLSLSSQCFRVSSSAENIHGTLGPLVVPSGDNVTIATDSYFKLQPEVPKMVVATDHKKGTGDKLEFETVHAHKGEKVPPLKQPVTDTKGKSLSDDKDRQSVLSTPENLTEVSQPSEDMEMPFQYIEEISQPYFSDYTLSSKDSSEDIMTGLQELEENLSNISSSSTIKRSEMVEKLDEIEEGIREAPQHNVKKKQEILRKLTEMKNKLLQVRPPEHRNVNSLLQQLGIDVNTEDVNERKSSHRKTKLVCDSQAILQSRKGAGNVLGKEFRKMEQGLSEAFTSERERGRCILGELRQLGDKLSVCSEHLSQLRHDSFQPEETSLSGAGISEHPSPHYSNRSVPESRRFTEERGEVGKKIEASRRIRAPHSHPPSINCEEERDQNWCPHHRNRLHHYKSSHPHERATFGVDTSKSFKPNSINHDSVIPGSVGKIVPVEKDAQQLSFILSHSRLPSSSSEQDMDYELPVSSDQPSHLRNYNSSGPDERNVIENYISKLFKSSPVNCSELPGLAEQKVQPSIKSTHSRPASRSHEPKMDYELPIRSDQPSHLQNYNSSGPDKRTALENYISKLFKQSSVNCDSLGGTESPLSGFAERKVQIQNDQPQSMKTTHSRPQSRSRDALAAIENYISKQFTQNLMNDDRLGDIESLLPGFAEREMEVQSEAQQPSIKSTRSRPASRSREQEMYYRLPMHSDQPSILPNYNSSGPDEKATIENYISKLFKLQNLVNDDILSVTESPLPSFAGREMQVENVAQKQSMESSRSRPQSRSREQEMDYELPMYSDYLNKFRHDPSGPDEKTAFQKDVSKVFIPSSVNYDDASVTESPPLGSAERIVRIDKETQQPSVMSVHSLTSSRNREQGIKNKLPISSDQFTQLHQGDSSNIHKRTDFELDASKQFNPNFVNYNSASVAESPSSGFAEQAVQDKNITWQPSIKSTRSCSASNSGGKTVFETHNSRQSQTDAAFVEAENKTETSSKRSPKKVRNNLPSAVRLHLESHKRSQKKIPQSSEQSLSPEKANHEDEILEKSLVRFLVNHKYTSNRDEAEEMVQDFSAVYRQKKESMNDCVVLHKYNNKNKRSLSAMSRRSSSSSRSSVNLRDHTSKQSVSAEQRRRSHSLPVHEEEISSERFVTDGVQVFVANGTSTAQALNEMHKDLSRTARENFRSLRCARDGTTPSAVVKLQKSLNEAVQNSCNLVKNAPESSRAEALHLSKYHSTKGAQESVKDIFVNLSAKESLASSVAPNLDEFQSRFNGMLEDIYEDFAKDYGYSEGSAHDASTMYEFQQRLHEEMRNVCDHPKGALIDGAAYLKEFQETLRESMKEICRNLIEEINASGVPPTTETLCELQKTLSNTAVDICELLSAKMVASGDSIGTGPLHEFHEDIDRVISGFCEQFAKEMKDSEVARNYRGLHELQRKLDELAVSVFQQHTEETGGPNFSDSGDIVRRILRDALGEIYEQFTDELEIYGKIPTAEEFHSRLDEAVASIYAKHAADCNIHKGAPGLDEDASNICQHHDSDNNHPKAPCGTADLGEGDVQRKLKEEVTRMFHLFAAKFTEVPEKKSKSLNVHFDETPEVKSVVEVNKTASRRLSKAMTSIYKEFIHDVEACRGKPNMEILKKFQERLTKVVLDIYKQYAEALRDCGVPLSTRVVEEFQKKVNEAAENICRQSTVPTSGTVINAFQTKLCEFVMELPSLCESESQLYEDEATGEDANEFQKRSRKVLSDKLKESGVQLCPSGLTELKKVVDDSIANTHYIHGRQIERNEAHAAAIGEVENRVIQAMEGTLEKHAREQDQLRAQLTASYQLAQRGGIPSELAFEQLFPRIMMDEMFVGLFAILLIGIVYFGCASISYYLYHA